MRTLGEAGQPPLLERWSRSQSHRSKLKRHPLVPQNKATRGRAVGLQEKPSSVSAWARAVWALRSWVPSVGGDRDEAGWWQYQTSWQCLMGEKKIWNRTYTIEVLLHSEMNLLGPKEKVHFDQNQVDSWFFCLSVNTLERFQMRHEWIWVGTQSSQSQGL